MPRLRNPRVVAVGQVNSMRRRLEWLRWSWGDGRRQWGTVRDHVSDTWRKRTPEELPENDVEKWGEMIEVLTDVMLEADDLRRFAREQIEIIEAKGK